MRTHANQRLKRSIIPTAVSVAIHAGLAFAIVKVTVEHLQPQEDRPRLLDITAVPADHSQHEQPDRQQTDPESTSSPTLQFSPERAEADADVERQAETARDVAATTIARSAKAPPPPALRPLAPPPTVHPLRTAPAASFAGVQAQAATRIVYAVDVSGAMVHTLSFVLDELARSIGRLRPTQSFQIVLFSDRPEAPTVRTPPIDPDDDGLIRATARNRSVTTGWLNTVIAGGRSAPIEGLESSLELNPDLVFLLARGIQRTGSTPSNATTTDSTIARLDALNPLDNESGYRPAVIKTLQFIEPDPTGLLTRIAQIHGDGADSTRVISPEDMRGVTTTPATTPLSFEPDNKTDRTGLQVAAPEFSAAADALAHVENTLISLALLAGVATDEERTSVRTAADTALRTLSEVPPATRRTRDPRANLLRAKAALIRAVSEPADSEASRAWRDDYASRALADARPLSIIDPNTDADRDLIVAQSLCVLGNPSEAHDRILAVLENAPDSRLAPSAIIRAEIARLTAATLDDPGGDTARSARTAIESSLAAHRPTAAPPESPWADPAWRAIASASLALSRRTEGAPTDHIIAPLLSELGDSGPRPSEPDGRRALIAPRLRAVAGDLGDLPSLALSVLADHARWSDRPLEAAELLLRAHELDPAPVFLRDAASILHTLQDPRSHDLFFRFALSAPDHPDAPAALTASFGSQDSIASAPPDRLRRAIGIAPDHALAPTWRTALARTVRGLKGLDLLDAIDPLTSDASILAQELIDELLNEHPGDPDLLGRAADLADRQGNGTTPDRRLELATSLLGTDPARTLSTLEGFDPPEDSKRREADLLRLRALDALGDTHRAFTLARTLAQSLHHEHPGFWESNTRWLELGAQRGGPDATESARAHVARLRRIDPGLGGEPWRSRLDALTRLP